MATVNLENAKQTLTVLFNKIDTSGNQMLEPSELKVVFGEHADEFLKYCDCDGDKEVTLTEWLDGITADVAAMTEEDFQVNWVQRMESCIEAAGIAPAAAHTKLFCMGNPLLDISCVVEDALLEKYELKANDAILAEEKHSPIYAELQAMDDVTYVPGGATQNSARVAQALLKVPKRVAYVGSVGKDLYSQKLKEASEAANVDVAYMVDESTPTGKCGVLITQGGNARSLVTELAAANNYKLHHAQAPAIQERIDAATVYYSAGFFQTVSPDTMIHVAKQAAESPESKIFCTNLSAPFLMMVPPFFEAIRNTMPYTDILFSNETEAGTFRDQMATLGDDSAGLKPEDTLEEVAIKVAAMPKVSDKRKRMVVITQGHDDTIVAYNGEVKRYPIIECQNLVDTNGAGDAFVGGFLAKLVMKADSEPEVLCKAGNYAANVIIQRNGCTYPEDFELPADIANA